MSKRNRQAQTSEQTKNEQIAIILAELENDIQHFKITVRKKDEQLNNFARIIKLTKTEYQKLHRENTELKKYILNKKKYDQLQQQHQQRQGRQQQKQSFQQYKIESDKEEPEEPTDADADKNNENGTHEISEPEKKTMNNKVGKKRLLKVLDYLNNTSHNAKNNRR